MSRPIKHLISLHIRHTCRNVCTWCSCSGTLTRHTRYPSTGAQKMQILRWSAFYINTRNPLQELEMSWLYRNNKRTEQYHYRYHNTCQTYNIPSFHNRSPLTNDLFRTQPQRTPATHFNHRQILSPTTCPPIYS